MSDEYLKSVLKGQDLADDSRELKDLQAERQSVESLLRAEFKDCSPTIRYGGSKAKGTLNREAFDLDIICYFPRDDQEAGGTLEKIYENVARALEKKYIVQRKTSALRLQGKDPSNKGKDFHIDVVPGRYIDEDGEDCFIFQKAAEKCRLKTNLVTHIDHVRGSGVVDSIRLLKLLKARRALSVKQFVFELLIIDLLDGKSAKSLDFQLTHALTTIRDTRDPITVNDPANPEGNDLTKAFDNGVWVELQTVSKSTLEQVLAVGWKAVFGEVQIANDEEKGRLLAGLAAGIARPTKPWTR